ncbi:MAG: hypothetical protein P8R04_00945 [Gammaproteobacteria bacterium]|nr:hypothetical protein [Gammaproteobacteria bacterium]
MKIPSVVIILLSWLVVTNVAAADLSELLGGINVQRDVVLEFDELRMSPKLRVPVAVKGTMIFSSEGIMTKTVIEPFFESVTISQHTVTLARGKKIRSMSLDARPGLAAFYSGLRALLSGDVATLERLFDAEVNGSGDHGGRTVRLSPKDAELAQFVNLLTIIVINSDVRSVRTEQASGAWQEMVFAPSGP